MSLRLGGGAERERERFVFRQLGPSRGIRRSSIRRRHVAPSTGRFYLSSPLGAFLSIICILLIQTTSSQKCATSTATLLPYLLFSRPVYFLPLNTYHGLSPLAPKLQNADEKALFSGPILQMPWLLPRCSVFPL